MKPLQEVAYPFRQSPKATVDKNLPVTDQIHSNASHSGEQDSPCYVVIWRWLTNEYQKIE